MWRIVKYIVILVVTVLIVDYVMTYSKPTKYFELHQRREEQDSPSGYPEVVNIVLAQVTKGISD